MHRAPISIPTREEKQLSQLRAERLGELHMDDKAGLVEKRSRPPRGLVDDLIGHHQVARPEFLTQAAGRATGDDVRDAKHLHREDVGPIRHDGGTESVPGSMTREKSDFDAFPLGPDDRRARRSEGRIHFNRLALHFLHQHLP